MPLHMFLSGQDQGMLIKVSKRRLILDFCIMPWRLYESQHGVLGGWGKK